MFLPNSSGVHSLLVSVEQNSMLNLGKFPSVTLVRLYCTGYVLFKEKYYLFSRTVSTRDRRPHSVTALHFTLKKDHVMWGADVIRTRSFFKCGATAVQVFVKCPLHTDSRCGKERRILIGPW